MLIVKTSAAALLRTRDGIFNVAERCIEDYKKGHDIIVVLSAMGKTTDRLIAQAQEISPPLGAQAGNGYAAATGEQVSVALMAMAMNSLAGEIPQCVPGTDAHHIHLQQFPV